MADVRIERSKTGMARIRRDAVKPSQVFQKVVDAKTGKLGNKLYGAIGRNGKLFSLDLESGELASTSKGASLVVVVGKFVIQTKDYALADQRRTTREQVATNEVFKVKGGSEKYANMGTLTDGRDASLNLADPFNDNYAVNNGRDNKNVIVLGTYEVKAQVAA